MKIKLQGQEVDLLIGMDAEFFLLNNKGSYVAAARVIPGLKHQPHVLKNGVCHPDGLSLEVGAPPADTPEGMITNLFTVLQEVKDLYLDPAGVTIAGAMEVRVNQVEGAQPEDLRFGCGTEFDANSSSMVKQVHQTNNDRRYSGFHIHLGFTSGQESNFFTYKDMSRLVKVLDRYVRQAGLGTTDRRATQYGGYGAFRVKPYGIEYRCMDCTVITNQRKLESLLRMLNDLPRIFAEAHE